MVLYLATHHPLHQAALINLGGRLSSNRTSIAQDRDAVRQTHDFLQPVRDVNHADPLRTEPTQRGEQGLGFGFRQGGGRFIEHQDASRARQSAGDLHQLLLGNAESGHDAPHVADLAQP